MSMAMEVKARDLVIADARSYFELRRYLNKEERGLARASHALWKRQRELVTLDIVETALRTGAIPPEWRDPWERMIREFVRDEIIPQWVKSIAVAGDGIAKNVNRLQRKEFAFDSTMTRVKAWIDNEGGKLIVNLTAKQIGSVHALLQDQIALGVTSPYVLAQRIRPMVGLTQVKVNVLAKNLASFIEQGLPASVINKQIERTAKRYHKQRAALIARTEISNAYNFGQMDSLQQAVAEGWLPGIPEKDWIAGGADPCEICLDNEAAGSIAIDAAFPSGDYHPTAHPGCECAVGYRVRR